MILVLAGTQDGRQLAAQLAKDHKVMVSVISQYGRQLASESQVQAQEGMLDTAAMLELFRRLQVELLVDASHPYAVNVSRNAMEACESCGVAYLRYERPQAALPAYDKLYKAPNYERAAEQAVALGKVIFLTTGSRHLKVFKTAADPTVHRLIARVLPEPGVLTECLKLGFQPRDIVAMQGPFSHELNKALFKEFGTEVVVSKNSGQIGGSDTKFSAARELGLPLVIIDRPALPYKTVVSSFAEVLAYVNKHVAGSREVT
ncbi:precorrin-6A reductase [Propionispora hippei]|uniref:Precorrin-6A/cobalt-precorrin-6A reductase n=1 Tax=Propionispora hippei DSM 15287 TaxID=1123003 RepID=A0A1M6A8E2_9FIRM|nr:precorrin-6A reductase [Propionispora hippei]SHI32709.1 precorrin-6A/cobalt-precorrin-6A reductase [Propionispora hippei DSM 15287]